MIKGNELTIGALVRSNNDYAKVTALYKEDDGIHVEGNVFCGDDSSPEEELALMPEGLEPVPLTATLLEMNGWVKKASSPEVYVHPLLGDGNKVVFDDVPHYRNIEVLYVHHFQNLLAIANKYNVDIDLQILCK